MLGQSAPAVPAPRAASHLLLTVLCASPGRFHARAIEPDGTVHEFCSPLELARWLARAAPPSSGVGLR